MINFEGVVLSLCPVDFCTWSYQHPRNTPSTYRYHMRSAEDAVSAHLDQHTVGDYLRTIKRLREELDAARISQQ